MGTERIFPGHYCAASSQRSPSAKVRNELVADAQRWGTDKQADDWWAWYSRSKKIEDENWQD